MSTNKAALKAAKAAIDAQKWDEAVVQAQLVLASDAQNYFAKLFLGRAQEKQGNLEAAAKTYSSATDIKPNEAQAWIGLQLLYEGQGGTKVDEYIAVCTKLAEIYVEADDKHKCQTVVDRLVQFARTNGTKAQYIHALEVQLPTSSVYDFLEGRVPHPSHTYTRIAEITEEEEKERVNRLIGERRTRLGATIGKVTQEVKREVYEKSPLEGFYQNVIDWSTDDEIRRSYEEKLLQRAYDTLLVLPQEKKKGKREQVQELARGMVVIKHPFELAWNIQLEWKDAEDFVSWDAGVIWEYIEFFPDRGLAKVLKGFVSSEVSPFEAKPKNKENQDGGVSLEQDEPLSSEDILLLMTEGFEDAKESYLAHRLMAKYYLHLEEYDTVIDTARRGLKLLRDESQKTGIAFTENNDALNSILATSLIYHQTPRNHPEAKALFEAILKRKPQSTSALIGLGLILEEETEYSEAITFLTKALERDPENARIGAEAAWCKAFNGDYATALQELENYLPQMKTEDRQGRDLRAQTLYRIGMCQWELAPSKVERKSRNGAYAQFLASIKTGPTFAPAYTSLGFYYADYAKDKKRARQCFQKAFELSPAEVEAAERLARSFADQGDWDIVEAIAQRVVDSGKTRPPPGSKKPGISWPYSALGVVQMNKQEYPKSIVSFLSALRINPNDYHSYVGLGESYHNSGRYNSAAKAFQSAEALSAAQGAQNVEDQWFTRYMLANVNRELGEHEEAIKGYKEVLATRSQEYGVELALLQTYIEQSWHYVDTGFFGRAVDSAKHAIGVAQSIVQYRPYAFNLWKAVGDACALFTWVQSGLSEIPFEELKTVLETGINTEEYNLFADVDGVRKDSIASLSAPKAESLLETCITASILAHKRAILTCADDIHAQAVAWYNLGWTEWRAHLTLGQPDLAQKRENKYVNAAIRCFKRAIELEAGNSEFWNALGVVTTQLSPKVAQHSFVRSLHLNERSAHPWANLGTLYLLQDDYELAHTAFSRAQSADPDYAHAWLGEGFIALLYGDQKEALLHFAHAFEIAGGASLITKRQYVLSTFDSIAASTTPTSITSLIQPLFALEQLRSQVSADRPFEHLAALYLERIGNHAAATEALAKICEAAEAEYEVTESASSLGSFIRAKSDLARLRLATKDYTSAAEDAETTLDLTSDLPEGMPSDVLKAVRLSARLIAGLAHYYLQDMDASITDFRAALEDTNSDPDVVCLLAKVLWAKGSTDERSVAKEQLFACIEAHPEHVGTVVLLGAMAVSEGDAETMDAVRDELGALRTRDLDTKTQRRVEKVLDAIAALSSEDGTGDQELVREIETSILLAPDQPHGWAQLTSVSEEPFAAQMALKTAARAVPPFGPLEAEDLSAAFASAGTVADAQRATMLSPWMGEGWRSLEGLVEG